MILSKEAVLKIDRAVTSALVAISLAKGYSLTVSYGEDEDDVSMSRDAAAINDALHACDEEWLILHDAAGKRLGSLYLIYGEQGWDVICDHTVSPAITELVEHPAIKALTDELADHPERWEAIIAEAQALAG